MNSDLTAKLESLKNDFYKENQKHFIFKNQQKNHCATMISNTMDINILLKNTFLINDNDNKIIFIYTLFKTYANNSNILEIINFLFAIIKDKIYRFNNFEMHVNMDTYTITAHKRYENLYTTFFTMCCENNIPFRVPSGLSFVTINNKTGLPSSDNESIMEAFIEGSEPYTKGDISILDSLGIINNSISGTGGLLIN